MFQLFRLYRFPVFILAFLFAGSLSAQQDLPMAEMRGAWVATVGNIDWPSAPGLSSDRQQMEFDSILDVLKAMGMNAVFVQIRPAGDAFYPSAAVPWSKYLTGQQGKAPEPFYDPLAYMIRAAHSRRMEFHAWMNPYRATFDLDTASLAPTHPLRSLPDSRKAEWFFRYGNRYYFNPASPLVRQHLISVVKDIVVRYDIDGIHFDDYFYPYKEPNQTLQDYHSFAADPRGFTTIEDWRRNNVDLLIEGVSKTIKGIKPYVRFGVSPFGVWRNADQDPLNGSQTRAGITCYDDLYADVVKWMKNGWIDYVAPQLYWSIGFPPADYAILLDWWSKHTYGKHLYAGHAAYKINNWPNDPNWSKPDEINRQVDMNRNNPLVQGSIYFSTRPLLRNPLGVQDSMINVLYPNQARMPGMGWMSEVPPATPQICRVGGTRSSVKLAWHACDIGSQDENPYYFAIYRFDGKSVGDFQQPGSLLAYTPFYTEKWIFEDPTAAVDAYYTYVIIAYNRYNVESYSSDPVVVKKTKNKAKQRKKCLGFLF
ncbi:MAG: glycoside hydrolase family 10 protein [Bacteroidetes bacterium]|nr:MAG: glycoside hydrolase family 10 protein [Bacteroidota bacterium]